MLMFPKRNMRIKHKYHRNRLFKRNARKKMVNYLGGEFSHKTFFPYCSWGHFTESYEEQLKRHQDWINLRSRHLDKGNHRGYYHAPKWFRNRIERDERRCVKRHLVKMMNGFEDVEIPTFKHNADWSWF